MKAKGKEYRAQMWYKTNSCKQIMPKQTNMVGSDIFVPVFLASQRLCAISLAPSWALLLLILFVYE